ncbi:hypothetical protein [Magnetovirga frankeli]|uniref:hypothetical protein n=1 Tax=Magnetovirga frankeli TaxID=947516 RepID=UPI003D354C91
MKPENPEAGADPTGSPRPEHPARLQLVPRFIRLRDAPAYLGMDRNRFNREVRPFIVEIRLGKQAIAFDRLDLDQVAEEYKARNGRPGQPKGEPLWDARKHPASSRGKESGTSTNTSVGGEFARALERINWKKPNVSSPD